MVIQKQMRKENFLRSYGMDGNKMDLQIKRNGTLVKLEVTLLSPEMERIVNSEMSNFERSEFVRLWNGDLMEKFRALSMVIRMSEVNAKTSFIRDMTI